MHGNLILSQRIKPNRSTPTSTMLAHRFLKMTQDQSTGPESRWSAVLAKCRADAIPLFYSDISLQPHSSGDTGHVSCATAASHSVASAQHNMTLNLYSISSKENAAFIHFGTSYFMVKFSLYIPRLYISVSRHLTFTLFQIDVFRPSQLY